MGALSLPSFRSGSLAACLLLLCCSDVAWNMDHAEFLPRDTAPPASLLLLAIQGPQIWILASRVSLKKESAEAV